LGWRRKRPRLFFGCFYYLFFHPRNKKAPRSLPCMCIHPRSPPIHHDLSSPRRVHTFGVSSSRVSASVWSGLCRGSGLDSVLMPALLFFFFFFFFAASHPVGPKDSSVSVTTARASRARGRRGARFVVVLIVIVVSSSYRRGAGCYRRRYEYRVLPSGCRVEAVKNIQVMG
jgi:hypothetical protein